LKRPIRGVVLLLRVGQPAVRLQEPRSLGFRVGEPLGGLGPMQLLRRAVEECLGRGRGGGGLLRRVFRRGLPGGFGGGGGFGRGLALLRLFQCFLRGARLALLLQLRGGGRELEGGVGGRGGGLGPRLSSDESSPDMVMPPHHKAVKSRTNTK
jgi:hypothetical protein